MDEEQVDELNFVLEQLSDPNAGKESFDKHRWRRDVLPKMLDGDIRAMNNAAAPFVQYEIIRTAVEGKSEQTKLTAGMFLLGQTGHGVVQKHQHQMEFTRMPADQLASLLSSKLARLQKLNPNFSVEALLLEARAGLSQNPDGSPMDVDHETVEVEHEEILD